MQPVLYSWCGRRQPIWWHDGFGGRLQDKALAHQRKALLRQFRLEKLVLRPGKQVGIGPGDGGDKVVHGDGLAVERSLLVGVSGQLHGLNGASVFGQNRPQVAVVLLTPSASSVSSAPGSKSARNTAPGCAASRVVELFPLAEIFKSNCAASGAAITFTASPFTMALNCTCSSWLAGESCSVFESA